jgi:lactate permease
VTRGGGDKRRSFFEMLPFAIWSGVVFVVSSALTVFMGVEFPSILGSAVGLIIILFTIKIGLFMPKNKQSLGSVRDTLATLSLKKTIFPYILLIAFLFVGKFVLGARGVPIPIAVKHTFTFFNPGFAFIFAGIIVSIFYKVPKNTFSWSLKKALVKSFKPFLVIVFMSSMAQIMVNSAQNFTGLPSMIGYLAANIKNAFLPFWSPIIGALGSFLTGSVTISNLMFGNFMATAAKELSFNVDTILALVVAGGAAGNMVALADILVAEAVVGLKNEERRILKGVILPCLIYVGLIGLIGLMVL